MINEQTSETKIAPVFDCGSSLYPQVTDNAIKEILLKNDEIDKRVYVFPNAALKEDNQKINYHDFLTKTSNTISLKAILEIVPVINTNLTKINDFIDNIPYISEDRKDFYRIMLKERYNKILIPALEHAREKNLITDKSISTRIEQAKQNIDSRERVAIKSIDQSIEK